MGFESNDRLKKAAFLNRILVIPAVEQWLASPILHTEDVDGDLSRFLDCQGRIDAIRVDGAPEGIALRSSLVETCFGTYTVGKAEFEELSCRITRGRVLCPTYMVQAHIIDGPWPRLCCWGITMAQDLLAFIAEGFATTRTNNTSGDQFYVSSHERMRLMGFFSRWETMAVGTGAAGQVAKPLPIRVVPPATRRAA